MNQKPSFISAESDLFSQKLNARVNNYFSHTGKSRNFDWYIVVKTLFYLGTFFCIYLALLFANIETSTRLLLAGALGFVIAQIGFNIGHDAIHRSLSSKTWVNTLLGHSFTLMGANVFVWRTLHNVIHHSYTNIHGADGDLHPVGALRFSKDAPLKPFHKYQYLYAPFLYALISLVWVFKKDFDYFKKANHLIYKKPPHSKRILIELYSAKWAYYIAFIVIPLAVTPASWTVVGLSFLLMHFVTGLTLTGVFQLGHLVEKTSFYALGEPEISEQSWATLQLKTSSNFATHNPLALWFSGGLNFQVEHHLFPRICHTHYPAISKIVKSTAKEFDLPYHEYPSFLEALRSHFRLMKILGHNEAIANNRIPKNKPESIEESSTFNEIHL